MLIATATVIGLTIPSIIHSDNSRGLQLFSPLDVLSDTSTISQVKSAISYLAVKYGIEPSELVTVINCESGFKVNAVGDNGLAYGLAQFHKPTFDGFCEGNYYSTKDQLVCMARMFQTPSLKLHWTCWRKYFSN